jgi:hypothetical protein
MALKICIFYMAAPCYSPGTALGGLQTRTRRRAQGACVALFVCLCACACVSVCECVCLHTETHVHAHKHTHDMKSSQCRRANLHTNLLRQPPRISPVLRQAVVFCLVDLYRALGEDLIPYLDAGLSNSQLKLVTIYINRLQA